MLQLPLNIDGTASDWLMPVTQTQHQSKRSAGPGEYARRWVLAPAAHLLEGRYRLRHAPSTVVLETREGGIWALTMTDQAWTDERIAIAAEVLTQACERLTEKAMADLITDRLEVPQVRGIPLPSQTEWLSVFHVDALVDALVRWWIQHQATPPAAADAVVYRDACQRALTAELTRVLGEFAAGLNRSLLQKLSQRELPLSMYGYLSHPQHARYRQQFGLSHPVLLQALCEGVQERTAWNRIRLAIDSGASAPEAICREFQVRPSVLRVLRAVPPAWIAEPDWIRAPERLMGVLEAIDANLRPRSLDEWSALVAQYRAALALFRASTARHALVTAQITRTLAAARRGESGASLTDIAAADIARVEQLRQSMVDALMADAGDITRSAMIQRRARVLDVTDAFLATRSWKPLLQLVRRWELALQEAIDANADLARFMDSGSAFDILPDGRFVTASGIEVVCVCSAADLQKLGRALANCLATGYQQRYASACASGQGAILAVLDPQTGAPTSSAFIALSIEQDLAGGEPGVLFQVAEHRAARNRIPSEADQQALAELLANLSTRRWQKHVQRGLWASRQRASLQRRGGKNPVQMLAHRDAVNSALGDVRFGDLLSRVRDADGDLVDTSTRD